MLTVGKDEENILFWVIEFILPGNTWLIVLTISTGFIIGFIF